MQQKNTLSFFDVPSCDFFKIRRFGIPRSVTVFLSILCLSVFVSCKRAETEPEAPPKKSEQTPASPSVSESENRPGVAFGGVPVSSAEEGDDAQAAGDPATGKTEPDGGDTGTRLAKAESGGGQRAEGQRPAVPAVSVQESQRKSDDPKPEGTNAGVRQGELERNEGEPAEMKILEAKVTLFEYGTLDASWVDRAEGFDLDSEPKQGNRKLHDVCRYPEALKTALLSAFNVWCEDLKVREHLAFVKSLRLKLECGSRNCRSGFSLSYFVNLEELDISESVLNGASLPDFVTGFGNVRTLNISNSGISDISPDIRNLEKLEHLIAHSNQYKEREIPRSLFYLGNLKSLDLSHSNIAYIDEHIYYMKSLERLNLENNQLKATAGSMQFMDQLLWVNFKDNQFGNASMNTLLDCLSSSNQQGCHDKMANRLHCEFYHPPLIKRGGETLREQYTKYKNWTDKASKMFLDDIPNVIEDYQEYLFWVKYNVVTFDTFTSLSEQTNYGSKRLVFGLERVNPDGWKFDWNDPLAFRPSHWQGEHKPLEQWYKEEVSKGKQIDWGTYSSLEKWYGEKSSNGKNQEFKRWYLRQFETPLDLSAPPYLQEYKTWSDEEMPAMDSAVYFGPEEGQSESLPENPVNVVATPSSRPEGEAFEEETQKPVMSEKFFTRKHFITEQWKRDHPELVSRGDYKENLEKYIEDAFRAYHIEEQFKDFVAKYPVPSWEEVISRGQKWLYKTVRGARTIKELRLLSDLMDEHTAGGPNYFLPNLIPYFDNRSNFWSDFNCTQSWSDHFPGTIEGDWSPYFGPYLGGLRYYGEEDYRAKGANSFEFFPERYLVLGWEKPEDYVPEHKRPYTFYELD